MHVLSAVVMAVALAPFCRLVTNLVRSPSNQLFAKCVASPSVEI